MIKCSYRLERYTPCKNREISSWGTRVELLHLLMNNSSMCIWMPISKIILDRRCVQLCYQPSSMLGAGEFDQYTEKPQCTEQLTHSGHKIHLFFSCKAQYTHSAQISGDMVGYILKWCFGPRCTPQKPINQFLLNFCLSCPYLIAPDFNTKTLAVGQCTTSLAHHADISLLEYTLPQYYARLSTQWEGHLVILV